MPSVNYIIHVAENMYQAVPTYIASDDKLGGRWERGQQAHISPLHTLFVRHTKQVYIMQSKRVCMGTFSEPIA